MCLNRLAKILYRPLLNEPVVQEVVNLIRQSNAAVHSNCIIAVAGGSSKARAIAAYMKNAPEKTYLITDEGAAKMILKG